MSVETPTQIDRYTRARARAAMTATAPLAIALASPCPDCAILKLCAPPLASIIPVNHGVGRDSATLDSATLGSATLGSATLASAVATAGPGLAGAGAGFALATSSGARRGSAPNRPASLTAEAGIH